MTPQPPNAFRMSPAEVEAWKEGWEAGHQAWVDEVERIPWTKGENP